MPIPNVRVLFQYRLLVAAGYLDDDVFGPDRSRSEAPPGRIAVDRERCIGCYGCRSACPESAIGVWDDLAHVVDPLACPPCADTPCIVSCPTEAISERGADAAPG